MICTLRKGKRMAKKTPPVARIKRPKVQTVSIAELHPAEYNPRADLQPGDPDYENIRQSIETYGLLDDIIWNKRSGNVIGGHQRLKVLAAAGIESVDVKVVDLSPGEERSLNIMLNKAVGRWDEPRLLDLIDELGEMKDAGPTGWTEKELEPLRIPTDFPDLMGKADTGGPVPIICPKCGHEFEK